MQCNQHKAVQCTCTSWCTPRETHSVCSITVASDLGQLKCNVANVELYMASALVDVHQRRSVASAALHVPYQGIKGGWYAVYMMLRCTALGHFLMKTHTVCGVASAADTGQRTAKDIGMQCTKCQLVHFCLDLMTHTHGDSECLQQDAGTRCTRHAAKWTKSSRDFDQIEHHITCKGERVKDRGQKR